MARQIVTAISPDEVARFDAETKAKWDRFYHRDANGKYDFVPVNLDIVRDFVRRNLVEPLAPGYLEVYPWFDDKWRNSWSALLAWHDGYDAPRTVGKVLVFTRGGTWTGRLDYGQKKPW